MEGEMKEMAQCGPGVSNLYRVTPYCELTCGEKEKLNHENHLFVRFAVYSTQSS
jgi:hypothetical protein